MNKVEAIRLLGGTPKQAAEAIGVTVHAVYQWTDPLTPKVADRVQAAVSRNEKVQKDSLLNEVIAAKQTIAQLSDLLDRVQTRLLEK